MLKYFLQPNDATLGMVMRKKVVILKQKPCILPSRSKMNLKKGKNIDWNHLQFGFEVLIFADSQAKSKISLTK